MLRWCQVLKLEQGFGDIAFHGEFYGSFGVVPVKVNSDVSVAFPVRFHGVVVTDGFFKVKSISFVDILYAKVIDDKGEGDGSGLVNEESGGVFGWEVSCFSKDFFKFFVGEHSGLFETVHGTSNFHVDISIWGNDVVEFVLVDDLLGDVGELHSHVFVSVQWSV